MRVIAGSHGGRRLRTPGGRPFRPTQGRVRQVLFDLVGGAVSGARVLDLFAGSGAIGIEALSRGASRVCFVERDKLALRCLRENIASLDLERRCRILATPVAVALRILQEAREPFEWIFSDPPYRSKPEEWIVRVARGGPGAVLEVGGTLVLETSRRSPASEEVGGLRRFRARTVGETSLEFYRWEGRSDGTQGDLSGDI